MNLNAKYTGDTILVHKKDTVWNISKRFRLPLRDIILINNLEAPYALNIGQRIKLPKPKEYHVRDRDSLYSISRLFRIDVHNIVSLNNLNSPYRLYTGQILRLPTMSLNVPKAEYVPPYRNEKIIQEPLDIPRNQYQQRPISIKPPIRVPQKPITRKSLPTTYDSKYKLAPKNKGFIWPVRGRILSNFGSKATGLHNDGINIAVPEGTPIKSISSGTVVYIGDDLDSFGNLVLIRHKGGWISAYGHLRDIKVKKGHNLNQGQTIGTVGRTGNVTTPQLHFELRKGSQAINPQKHLS